MRTMLLAATAVVALAGSASAGVLGIDVFDGATLIDSLSGITVGTANLTTSDAAFSNITVSVEGAPVLPHGDLSTVTLDATASSGFTGSHVLTIDVFQTAITANGPTESTFTINGLVGSPGPATESTYEGGTASTLGNLLQTHTFPVGDVTDHAGPFGNSVGAFTADASSYAITFTAASQSFGGSTQLTTNVPEASTWAMMIAGFALLAGLGWQKAKSARSIAA